MSDDLPFGNDVVAAILHHMNDDHPDDSVVIVRAHGATEADAAIMTGFDSVAGRWTVTEASGDRELVILWPVPIVDRASVRAAIVTLFTAAGGSH